MKLVGKLVARAAAAGALRIVALDHEVRDHAMKDRAVIKRFAGLGSLGQGDEVLHGARRLGGKQTDFELAFGGIEYSVDFVGHHSDCSKPVRTGPKRTICYTVSRPILMHSSPILPAMDTP